MDRRRLVLAVMAAGALIVVLATVLGFCAGRRDAPPPVSASSAPSGLSTPVSGLPTIAADRLPDEARDLLVLIDHGGPFKYSRDGIVFSNAEGILPQRPRGYYQEFTVDTPGSRDRGARRLVVGRDGDVYYTDDHYASFRQVLR